MPEFRRLDRIDCQILSALQKNARLPNKELAARVGIAQSTCLERVRRLREEGVLKGFRAAVEPKALGIGLQAMVAVRLRQHSGDLMAEVKAQIQSHPEVVECYYLAGANDFLMHVVVRDSDHLRDFVLTAFDSRPEVAHLETALIFERFGRTELPVFLDLDEAD